MGDLRVGMGQPYKVRFRVLASADFDPMVVTNPIIKVTKSNGTTLEWTATVENRSSAGVDAVYALNANGLDLDVPRTWRFWVQWSAPSVTPGPRTSVWTEYVKPQTA
jgi:hypothetical protein